MPPINLVLRLLLAAGLGAAIGLEREYLRKAAGLRTNILIAMGSALWSGFLRPMAHSREW